MIGRRWSDGLHQAVEAKEGVHVEGGEPDGRLDHVPELLPHVRQARRHDRAPPTRRRTSSSRSTALEVVVIPTHKPMIRDDAPDLVYLTAKDKFEAIIEDIQDCHTRGPAGARRHDVDRDVGVPVGAAEAAEDPAQGAEREVPRARGRDRQRRPGRPGTVTIATNMAGRGTRHRARRQPRGRARTRLESPTPRQITALERRLDASATTKVIEMGGLHIVGTERHESRRIDNQLRGRSGRQGDPGSSRFYLSLEDNLMRIFGDPERIKRLLSRAGMKRRRGDREQAAVAADRARAAQGRSAQLRHPQAAARVRRRRERSAQGRLPAARTSSWTPRRSATRSQRFAAEVVNTRRRRVRAAGERRGAVGQGRARQGASSAEFGVRFDAARLLEQDHTIDESALRRSRSRRRGRGLRAEGRRARSEAHARAREGHHAAPARYCTGRSTSARSTTCAKASTCAATRSATRSRSTSARRSEMFSAMLDRVKHDAITILSKIQIRRPEDVQAVEPDDAGPAHAQVPARRRTVARRAAAAARPSRRRRARRDARRSVRAAGRSRSEPVTPYVREQPKVGRNAAVPVRLGQEIQAVPRPPELTAVSVASPLHVLVGLIGDARGRWLVNQRLPGHSSRRRSGNSRAASAHRGEERRPRRCAARARRRSSASTCSRRSRCSSSSTTIPTRRVLLDVWRVLRLSRRGQAREGQALRLGHGRSELGGVGVAAARLADRRRAARRRVRLNRWRAGSERPG